MYPSGFSAVAKCTALRLKLVVLTHPWTKLDTEVRVAPDMASCSLEGKRKKKLLEIIIIKTISRAPIYHTRWQHRALYNNTHTHTHARTHARTHTHTHSVGRGDGAGAGGK